MVDTLLDDLCQQRVWSERGGDEETNAGVTRGGLGSEGRYVTVPMTAGPEEVRDDHHRGAPGRHAGSKCRINRRLSQLHVSGFDDAVSASPAPFLHKGLVVTIGFVAARPVVDDHDPYLIARRDQPAHPVGGGRRCRVRLTPAQLLARIPGTELPRATVAIFRDYRQRASSHTTKEARKGDGSTSGDVLHQLVSVLLELLNAALHHVPDADDPAQPAIFHYRYVTDPVLGHQIHDRLHVVAR